MKYLFVTFLLLISTLGIAQSSKLDHRVFTSKEGLTLDAIRAMEFDNDGFLWLGGIDNDIRDIIHGDQTLALQRFDGTTFHSVPLPRREERITRVDLIYKRDDGKFYVKAFGRSNILYLFDPISQEFKEIDYGDHDKGLIGLSDIVKYNGQDYILSQQDENISLNIITEAAQLKPVFSYSYTKRKFLMDSATKFIPLANYCIIGDDNFPLTYLDWSGTIIRMDSEESFSKDRGALVNKFWVDEIFRSDNEIYTIIDRYPQLHRLDEKSMKITPVKGEAFRLDAENINVYTDSNGVYWIVAVDTNGELLFQRMEEEGLQTVYSTKVADGPFGFELVSSNNNQDIWLGAANNTLHHFKFPQKKIKTYLDGYAIRAIHEFDEDHILVSTERDGWYKINTSSGEERVYAVLDSSGVFIPNSSRNIIPEGDFLWSSGGSNIINVEKNTGAARFFRHYPVTCLEKLNDSTLIYGSNGYKLMSFNTKRMTHIPLARTDTLGFNDIVITGDKKYILGATNKGLFRYEVSSGEANLFNEDDGLADPFLLSAEHHTDFGYLFGSRSGKIVRFDPNSASFQTLYEDSMQAGIASVLFSEGTWWINTFNGIVSYEPQEKISVRYSMNDGLSNNETNRYSALKTESGFWVGTIDGLNFFDPAELKPQKTDAELVLLKIRKYSSDENRIVDIFNRNQFNVADGIVLPAEYKELELDFSITENVYGRPHSYRYRLDDSEWNSIGEQKTLQFPNFAVGNYTLEIEALDFSGAKIGDSIKLDILSKDFFYRTWWFYLLLLLAALLLFTYLLKQAKLRSRLQQKFSADLLQSQEQERTRIAKELHDSVGQQLTLIKKKAQSEAQDEISDLTHRTLEEVRVISRGLYPAVLAQLGLTESIRQLVYELDEETSLFFSLEIDTIDDLLNKDQALNFYRFFQECFSNILKHSEATSVEVNIQRDDKRIHAEVADNGKGFSLAEAERRKSLGLKTLSERIRILGGTMRIISNSEEGTRITTEIKVK